MWATTLQLIFFSFLLKEGLVTQAGLELAMNLRMTLNLQVCPNVPGPGDL